MGPRGVLAPNAGPFTLDGTRTYVVGSSSVIVIDPGPDDEGHLAAIAEAVDVADEGTILLTHDHSDHAGGARTLAARTGYPVVGPGTEWDRPIRDGESVAFDGGRLEAVATPGHAADHVAYLMHPGRELFAGDLVLGTGTTTWVGGYAGCVADYLRSLDRVEALAPSVVFPSHGGEIIEPLNTIRAFRDHRLKRIAEVARAAEALDLPARLARGEDIEQLEAPLLEAVYGPDLSRKAREGARWSLRAALEYLEIVPFPTRRPG